MSRLLEDPFSAIILCLLAAGFIYTVYYQLRTRSRGIETTATVTEIIEHPARINDGFAPEWEIRVVYTAENGEQLEGQLSNPNNEFRVGERIRIRYLPRHPELPVFIDHL